MHPEEFIKIFSATTQIFRYHEQLVSSTV